MEENKEDSKKPHRDRHSGRLIITVHNPKNLGNWHIPCPY